MYKKVALLCIIFSIFTLSSCWDRVDIEERAFILGLAIDKAEEQNMVNVTYQIALPTAFGGEGGEKQDAVWNIGITAEDLAGAISALYTHINLIPSFQHMQVVLFGEEYARDGIEDSLDFFFRTTDVRRRTVVGVVEGRAKDVLDVKVKSTPVVSTYIGEIIEKNSNKNFEVFAYQNIGNIHQNYVRKSPIALSKVVNEKDKLEIAGAGIFKDYRLVGWFSGKEVEGERWLLGKVKSGVLSINTSEDKGRRIMLNIFNASSNIKPELKGDKIIMVCKILVEGDVSEVEKPDTETSSNQIVEEWEEMFEKQIAERTMKSFLKGRDYYGVDVFEMDKLMENYYPEFWTEHQDQWDEIFKTVELELEVDVKIRRVGEVKY